MLFFPKSPFSQKLNITTLNSENSTFSKTHEIEYTPSTRFKKTYIDEIEYHPSPICGEKPFESNETSFQFRQNTLAQEWPSAIPVPPCFSGENFSFQVNIILR